MLKISEKEGGIFPLLIPILAGIGALGSLAGAASGIAKTVIDKQNNEIKNQEQERHNKEIETIAKGNGLYLTKEGGKVIIKEFVNKSKLQPIAKKSLRNILKNLSHHFKIEKQGDGLFLSPL